MDLLPHRITHHLPCGEGIPNPALYVQFESQLRHELHSLGHVWLTDAFRNSYHLHYISTEGYGTLQQQYLSLLVAHHLIFCQEDALLWYFVCISRI